MHIQVWFLCKYFLKSADESIQTGCPAYFLKKKYGLNKEDEYLGQIVE
jgi:hypothetical protein